MLDDSFMLLVCLNDAKCSYLPSGFSLYADRALEESEGVTNVFSDDNKIKSYKLDKKINKFFEYFKNFHFKME